WKDDERVMVAPVPGEVSDRLAVLIAFRLGKAHAEVDRVRDAEADQPGVKVARHFRVLHVDAEMAQAQELERPRQAHAADVEFLTYLCHASLRNQAFIPRSFAAVPPSIAARSASLRPGVARMCSTAV